MKTVNRNILPFQEKDIFIPIRDKIEYARLIVHSARLLLLNVDSNGVNTNSTLKLIVDRMSRLFFYKENKFFSISFPFNTIIDANEILEINTYSGKRVDNHTISSVISILNNDQFKLNPSPVDFWIETNMSDLSGLSLLEEIFLFEPSYIRYDNDTKNESGKLHPLHHLDVNYSSSGTYKIGLNGVIQSNYFENILNITTECSFLTD